MILESSAHVAVTGLLPPSVATSFTLVLAVVVGTRLAAAIDDQFRQGAARTVLLVAGIAGSLAIYRLYPVESERLPPTAAVDPGVLATVVGGVATGTAAFPCGVTARRLFQDSTDLDARRRAERLEDRGEPGP